MGVVITQKPLEMAVFAEVFSLFIAEVLWRCIYETCQIFICHPIDQVRIMFQEKAEPIVLFFQLAHFVSLFAEQVILFERIML